MWRRSATSCADVYLLALHKPIDDPAHLVPVNAFVVHALTLLNARVPQPDGAMIYRCLTEFPDRTPGCVVPLSTLTHELDGGQLWPQIADWERVIAAVLALTRAGGCDAVPLGLPPVAATLLANGPASRTVLHLPGDKTIELGPDARASELANLTAQIRQLVAGGAMWPGHPLVEAPARPHRLPYRQYRSAT